MANRYQPRAPRAPSSSITALEVLRSGNAMYPDVEVGSEEGVDPSVFLNSQQSRLDAYAGGVKAKRDFAVGGGKALWELHKHGALEKFVGKKAVAPTIKEMTDVMTGEKWMGKVAGSGSKATGLRGRVAQLGESSIGKFASKTGGQIATGTKALGAGLKVGAGNVAAGTPFAGAGAGASAMTSIGAAAPPLLAAIAISKLIGRSQMGKQWNKSTNKWLKKATGTGRSKNLLSPWKWRL